MEIAVREMVEMRRLIVANADCSGRRPSASRWTSTDDILRGEAAVHYGVVDHVVEAAGRRQPPALPEPAEVLQTPVPERAAR